LKPYRSPVLQTTTQSENREAEIKMGQPNVTTLTDSATQQISRQKVLIHSRVRSHPAPVLPVAGGRYSHGVVVPFRVLAERSQPEGYPLMCFSISASRDMVHSRVLRISRLDSNPKVQIIPFRLYYPFHNTSINASDKVWLIDSPHPPGCLTVPCMKSSTLPPTTRSPV
jgi:hypothetical protein